MNSPELLPLVFLPDIRDAFETYSEDGMKNSSSSSVNECFRAKLNIFSFLCLPFKMPSFFAY